MHASVDWQGRLQLLVLQPTPFCNLDCSYCYLPHRSDRRRMSFETLEAVCGKVFAARLHGPRLSIIWHAGEPMVVEPEWYEEAFERIARLKPAEVLLEHHFQTNGVLISPRWTRLIRQRNIHIGVSIDGPAFLHDVHRKTRDGRGTHAQVMRGVKELLDANISFHVICVLTQEALAYADEMFEFFSGLTALNVGFNIEEIEADHTGSSLAGPGVEAEYGAFFRRLIELRRVSTRRFAVREIDSVLAALRSPDFGRVDRNSQNEPGRILSVAWDGSYTTWSPELLGSRHPQLGPLALGNMLSDDAVPPVRSSALASLQAEIDRGIDRCHRDCRYFDFCLGGTPANKLAEHGRLDGTETMFCRLTQKALVDVVLAELERDLETQPT